MKRLGKAQQVLLGDERVLDGATGLIQVRRMGSETARSGVVLATDRRVILFTTKIGGYDVQDFAYGLLTGVDHKKGIVFGDLHLNAAGDRAHVKQVPKADIERLAQAIRDQMALARRPAAHAQPPQPAAPADPHEELRKLAALRDEGIITTDDFEAKKRQLLGL
jgi:Bacterial PH domain/Short C-terminal domain